MPVGKLAFEHDVGVVGPGDVAGAAGAGAVAFDRRVHGGEHVRILAHAEVVVGAPHGDLLALAAEVADRAREGAGLALKLGEDPVTPLGPEPVDLVFEKTLIIHMSLLPAFRVC